MLLFIINVSYIYNKLKFIQMKSLSQYLIHYRCFYVLTIVIKFLSFGIIAVQDVYNEAVLEKVGLLVACSCLLLPPLASYYLLLPPLASSCLLLPPLASSCLLLPAQYLVVGFNNIHSVNRFVVNLTIRR